MKENVRENSRISSFAKHWQRVFFEANLKLLKERKHLQNSNLFFFGSRSQVFENLKILKQYKRKKMSEKRKIQLFEKRNIPKFLSSQVFRKIFFLNIDSRKEKNSQTVGRKRCRSSKVYPKVKFKSYVFRKGRMKFRR